jgi:hypothetical protein
MTDDRKSGILFIIGSLAGILTMAIHPVARGSLTVEQAAHLSVVSGIAHSLAMVSLILMFLGACGLTKSIVAADRLSFAAIVVYGFACLALFVAATVSGFIIPVIMKHMVRDASASAHQWEIVIDGIFQINQAFARVYSIAASIAIMLWSASALRNGGFSRGLATYGCIVSTLIIVGIAVSHSRLDVHGMAAIWLGQAIWFLLVGSQLCSRKSPAQPGAAP